LRFRDIVEVVIRLNSLYLFKIVALIATVTFTVAFTLPGGYKSNRGTAILAKKTAFIVFVISDVMSIVLSILAVFIHFLISLIKSFDSTEILFGFATLFTMIGMEIMIIAISICLIGLSFFFLVYLVFKDHLQGFTRLNLLVKQSILNFLSNQTPMYFLKKFLLFLKNNCDVICSEIMFVVPKSIVKFLYFIL